MPQTTTDARPALLAQLLDARLGGEHGGLTDLRGAGRDRAEHRTGVALLEQPRVVQDVVGALRHAGLRASSTSSTGMSSRTG